MHLGQSQWSVSMHCFQNKSANRASMKRIMKQPPQCMSFTLTFSRLGKAFNYCKMIGSHAIWWNDLAQWGFHPVSPRGKQRPRGFIMVKLLPSLSSSFHAKSTILLTWRSNKCAWHSGKTPTKTGLILRRMSVYSIPKSMHTYFILISMYQYFVSKNIYIYCSKKYKKVFINTILKGMYDDTAF